MRLLILGASGGCGRWAVRLARERGHEVTAVVRPTTPFDAPAGVTVVRGDVLDADVLAGALRPGTDGILCCLGHKRKNPWNPWSAIPPPHDLLQRVAAHLVDLAPRHGVRRVVVISSAGVGSSAARTTPLLRWLFGSSSIGIAFADLDAREQAFGRSALDWVSVRPTRLIDGPPSGRVVGTDWFGFFARITRGDVAAWMLDTVERMDPVTDRTPMITAG